MHPSLIAVSDSKSLQGIDLFEWAAGLAQGGIHAIQLREKDLTDRALLNTAVRLRTKMPQNMQLYINGRPDIAILCGAQGVHLPAQGLPIEPVRQRFRSTLRIGQSTHSLREVKSAQDDGADYVFLGPIFDSPEKRKYGDPLGLSILERAVETGIPVYAIGGISIDRVDSIAATGAAGVAGIRVFQDADLVPRLVDTAQQRFSASNISLGPTGRRSQEAAR